MERGYQNLRTPNGLRVAWLNLTQIEKSEEKKLVCKTASVKRGVMVGHVTRLTSNSMRPNTFSFQLWYPSKSGKSVSSVVG